MIEAWRLAKKRHAKDAFSGDWARLYGSRWSSPGTTVTFASESRALAVLEVLVHTQQSVVIETYSLCLISFPEKCVTVLNTADLPDN